MTNLYAKEIIKSAWIISDVNKAYDGCLIKLRQGIYDQEKIDQLLAAIESITLDQIRNDFELVSLIWDIPYRVELYCRYAGLSENKFYDAVRRLLGSGPIN